MLYQTIDQLEDYCGEFAGDFDLEEAAHYILFELDETVDTIDADKLNEVLDMFDTTREN